MFGKSSPFLASFMSLIDYFYPFSVFYARTDSRSLLSIFIPLLSISPYLASFCPFFLSPSLVEAVPGRRAPVRVDGAGVKHAARVADQVQHVRRVGPEEGGGGKGNGGEVDLLLYSL